MDDIFETTWAFFVAIGVTIMAGVILIGGFLTAAWPLLLALACLKVIFSHG